VLPASYVFSVVAARANGARRYARLRRFPRGAIPAMLRNCPSARKVRTMKRPEGRAPAPSWLGR